MNLLLSQTELCEHLNKGGGGGGGGYVSKETVVLRRWGVLQDNLVLSTELIM